MAAHYRRQLLLHDIQKGGRLCCVKCPLFNGLLKEQPDKIFWIKALPPKNYIYVTIDYEVIDGTLMQGHASILQLVRKLHESHRDECSDGELLHRFLVHPEQAAFATLVSRHGTMVFHVCRRVLVRSHDVEDAFQATFLVLVQKARQLQHRKTVGDWLHGVAHHTALKARAMITKRITKERAAARPVQVISNGETEPWQHILDEEVRRLPQSYRKAFILCDLQQKTRKEAAKVLGWREGTVASRLARGRSILCNRLKKRGVEITAALVSAELAQAVQATALPLTWVQAVTLAACQLANGVTVISAASVHVATLMKAGLASTITHKASILVAAVALAVGITGWYGSPPNDLPSTKEKSTRGTIQAGAATVAKASSIVPSRASVVSPAGSSEIMLAKIDQPPVKHRSVQGTDEEIVLDLGLSDEQLADFLMVRNVLITQTQEMYKLTHGRRERGLEINREWNASLMQILTPEQYFQYYQYWDDRTFRASR